MPQASGRQLLSAAGIIGVAVVVGSLVMARAVDRVTQQLDRTTSQLDEIRGAVVAARDALSNLKVAAAPAAAPSEADSGKRYEVSVAGAPTLGPATAAVTVVEFADFQ